MRQEEGSREWPRSTIGDVRWHPGAHLTWARTQRNCHKIAASLKRTARCLPGRQRLTRREASVSQAPALFINSTHHLHAISIAIAPRSCSTTIALSPLRLLAASEDCPPPIRPALLRQSAASFCSLLAARPPCLSWHSRRWTTAQTNSRTASLKRFRADSSRRITSDTKSQRPNDALCTTHEARANRGTIAADAGHSASEPRRANTRATAATTIATPSAISAVTVDVAAYRASGAIRVGA